MRLMRDFKADRGARIVCRGHGFLRNLSAIFYDARSGQGVQQVSADRVVQPRYESKR